MNIVLLSNLFPNPVEPFRGMFNFHIAKNLASLGNDVKVVSPLPFFPSIPILQFMDKWYKFSQIPYEKNFGNFNAVYPKYPIIPKISDAVQSFLMIPTLYKALKKIKCENGIDVVNVHYLYPDGVAACRVCNILKIPVVVSALGSDVNVLIQNKWIAGQVKSSLVGCAAITTVSEDLALKVRDLGINKRKIHVLNNGVDLSLFSLLDRNIEKEKMGIPGDNKIILYVGRLSPEKGLGFLLEAVNILKNQWPNLRIVLIGDGPDLHKLVEICESLDIGHVISFVGEKTPEQINSWLGISSLLCLPSIREGCPNVILEAFASGRPVVGSRVGGIPEMIEEGKNGFLFESADVTDLAEKLDRTLNTCWDPVLIRKSVENRSWASVAGRYMDTYQKSIQY